MKAHLRVNALTFEIEGDTPKKLFAAVAGIQEVFDAERTCGVCGSKDRDGNHYDLKYVVRKVQAKGGSKAYTYYEIRCTTPGCYARFSFGENLEGGNLFPKRKDEHGNYLPNRGWVKYQKQASGAAAEEPHEDVPF